MGIEEKARKKANVQKRLTEINASNLTPEQKQIELENLALNEDLYFDPSDDAYWEEITGILREIDEADYEKISGAFEDREKILDSFVAAHPETSMKLFDELTIPDYMNFDEPEEKVSDEEIDRVAKLLKQSVNDIFAIRTIANEVPVTEIYDKTELSEDAVKVVEEMEKLEKEKVDKALNDFDKVVEEKQEKLLDRDSITREDIKTSEELASGLKKIREGFSEVKEAFNIKRMYRNAKEEVKARVNEHYISKAIKAVDKLYEESNKIHQNEIDFHIRPQLVEHEKKLIGANQKVHEEVLKHYRKVDFLYYIRAITQSLKNWVTKGILKPWKTFHADISKIENRQLEKNAKNFISKNLGKATDEMRKINDLIADAAGEKNIIISNNFEQAAEITPWSTDLNSKISPKLAEHIKKMTPAEFEKANAKLYKVYERENKNGLNSQEIADALNAKNPDDTHVYTIGQIRQLILAEQNGQDLTDLMDPRIDAQKMAVMRTMDELGVDMNLTKEEIIQMDAVEVKDHAQHTQTYAMMHDNEYCMRETGIDLANDKRRFEHACKEVEEVKNPPKRQEVERKYVKPVEEALDQSVNDIRNNGNQRREPELEKETERNNRPEPSRETRDTKAIDIYKKKIVEELSKRPIEEQKTVIEATGILNDINTHINTTITEPEHESRIDPNVAKSQNQQHELQVNNQNTEVEKLTPEVKKKMEGPQHQAGEKAIDTQTKSQEKPVERTAEKPTAKNATKPVIRSPEKQRAKAQEKPKTKKHDAGMDL